MRSFARQYAVPTLILAAGGLLAYAIVATGPELQTQTLAPDAPAVEILVAEPRTVNQTVTTHGTVAPQAEGELVAEVSGRVIWVAPTLLSGEFFRQGEDLVRIERIDYELELERAVASEVWAESNVAIAERNFTRQEELRSTQLASEEEFDNAQLRLEIAKAALREADARRRQAERDLERTVLTAPFDGRVRREQIEAGQFVNRGQSLATLYSIDYAEVRLPVPDEELSYLPFSLDRDFAVNGEGPKVALRARFAGAEHSWSARLVRSEGELDANTRTVNLIARLERPYDQAAGTPPLVVGLFVEAEIEGLSIPDIVVAPRAAVQPGNQIYLVDGDNRLRFREAEIFRIVGDEVYLRNVNAGERICISTLRNAVEGQSVRPTAS